MYPTLAEVLDLPVLRAARPRVRAGSAVLDVRVRWVHVSEQRNPAGTLSGGELVLSTGIAMTDPATAPAAYVAALRDAGAVGLVVEVGQHVPALPDALVQAARAAEFPLVELTRAVRFVEVTEIVHALILNSQYARMQFMRRGSAASGRPILRLDDRARGRMLATRSAFLEAGGGMTAFAAAVGLSRPAAYARVARLRQLLGRDPGEPRMRLSLHLALLALQQDRERPV